MSSSADDLAVRLRERFPAQLTSCACERGEVTAELPPEHLLEVGRALRDEPDFSFEQLTDVCGMDYSEYGRSDWETSDAASAAGFSRGVEQWQPGSDNSPRFAVVYHLLSYRHNRRLRLRVHTPGDPPRVDSVIELWSAANWFEREAFDLFGILFEGHPDLRRLLTDYGFVGHPFRKDFPLIGQVEVRYDPDKQRVVYEPVSITPRTLVPRVIRDDNRYLNEVTGDKAADGDVGDA